MSRCPLKNFLLAPVVIASGLLALFMLAFWFAHVIRSLWLADEAHTVLCDSAGMVVVLIALFGGGVYWFGQRNGRSYPLANDILAAFSHELKTPLTSISLTVHYLLNHDSITPQKTREKILLINRETRRLTQFIDGLLSFSLIEQGKFPFYFESTDINEVVRASMIGLADKYEQNLIVLNLELSDNELWVMADQKLLQSAIFNMLDNACQYTFDCKPITIRSYKNADNVVIDIIDQGIGLSESDTLKVFEKFYRVDHSLQSQTRGCGIGLTFAFSVVNKHRGRILVDSCLGLGSTFTIILPIESDSG